jgi:hypothetical protein
VKKPKSGFETKPFRLVSGAAQFDALAEIYSGPAQKESVSRGIFCQLSTSLMGLEEIERMIWAVPALAASLLYAAYGHVNAIFKLPGAVLNIYRGAVPFLLLLPLVPLLPLPDAWQFYALTAVNGLIISYTDTRLFDAAARFGSAQILRLQPLVLVLVFLIWLPLDMEHTQRLLGNGAVAAGVFAALIAACISLFLMTRSPVTSDALRYFLPAILASSLIDPINKLTTRYSHGITGALSYAVFTSLFVFLFLLPYMVSQIPAREIASARHILAGLAIGMLSIAFNIFKNLAMSWAPNPAFVTALILCSGLWATGYARLRGAPDEHNIAAGVLFVLSTAALLVLGTSL